ncbi:DUF1158 family protein [Salmonella enterica subsp. enterica]|nr:DUF1158 family protein [Salmonella enterica subsp. enterica]
MKHPLESLMTAAGILLDGVVSVPAAARPRSAFALAQNWSGSFHLMTNHYTFVVLFMASCRHAGILLCYSLYLAARWFRWPIKHFNARTAMLCRWYRRQVERAVCT